MIHALLICVLLGVASVSHAATYYVGTTGNDANPGTSGSRWLNPQKCVQSGTPLVAGDTCIIGSGTYTNETGSIPGGWKGRIMVINSSSPVATAAARITIKSEVPNGAIFQIPSTWTGVDCAVASCPFAGIYASGNGSHYTFEGIRFTGGTAQLANATIAGITLLTATTGVIIRGNEFENIARTVCSNSTLGNVGVFADRSTGLLVEKNVFRAIGRLRNGESGCSTTIFHHDHAIYLEASTDALIQRNLIYDVTRGFGINLKARVAGTKTLRAKIYHNTLSGDSPTTKPEGQIALTNQLDDVQIKNNIFNDPEQGYLIWTTVPGFSYSTVPVGAGIIIQHNLSNSTRTNATVMLDQASFSLITSSDNIMNTATGLKNPAANEFTLATGSAAIDAGVALAGVTPNGAGLDIGAFETIPFSSCQVPTGAAATIQASFVSNLFPPLTGTFGTFTARRNGSNNALTGAVTKIGDNILSLPLTTSYAGGDTADISWSSGTFTDSALIGGYLNQPYIQTLSNQACTNNSTGSGYTFTQARYQFRGVHGPETTTDIRGSDNIPVYETVTGGAARIRFSVTCSVADCPPTSFFLRYSRNGGAYTVTPDAYGADNIGLCGTHLPSIGVENATPTTEQLPAISGTFVPGGVLLNANAIPTISGMNVGYKTELEYCVSFDTDASGDYTYKLYEQNGTPITYSQIPQISIVNNRSPAGF